MSPPNDNSSGATPPPPTATSSAASGCPVLAGGGDDPSSSARPGLWSRWFSRAGNDNDAPSANAPLNDTSASSSAPTASGCPVKGAKSTPASIEEAANHPQTPAPGQRIPLSTQRVISSIPRGEADDNAEPTTCPDKPTFPAHQPVEASRWQYPSEQQFYNAMLRKGYRPPVESIPDVLRIHNAVNERSWTQVCKWERELHDNDNPTLAKFVGRPKDLSPRAWWNSRVLMTQEPFDRHDWYVEDVDGGDPRRYVIDFYEGKEAKPSAMENAKGAGAKGMGAVRPPSMYIDVRPALDNPSAAVDRMAMFAREALPGLAGAWDSYRTSTASSAPSAAGAGMENRRESGKR